MQCIRDRPYPLQLASKKIFKTLFVDIMVCCEQSTDLRILNNNNSGRYCPAMNTRSKAAKRRGDETQQLEQKIRKLNSIITIDKSNFFEDTDLELERAPILKLNEYCFENILKFLPVEERFKMELVCKKWRTTIQFFWFNVKNLHYTFNNSICGTKEENEKYYSSVSNFRIKYSYMPRLFTLCGQYVQTLNLSGLTNSIIFTKLKGHFPNLIRLTIRVYECDNNDHFKNLFQGMNKLEILQIIKYYHLNLPAILFSSISRHVAVTLKELSISNVISHGFPKTRNVYYSKVTAIWWKTILQLKSLHSLEISGFYFKGSHHIRGLSSLNLLTLNLGNSLFHSSGDIHPVVELISLNRLVLCRCYGNCDFILVEIAQRLKNLKYLHLFRSNISDTGIRAVAKIGLTKLILENSNYAVVTDKSIQELNNLEIFSIKNYRNITDASITKVINNSPFLRILEVFGTAITRQTLVCAANFNLSRDKKNPKLKIKTDLPKSRIP